MYVAPSGEGGGTLDPRFTCGSIWRWGGGEGDRIHDSRVEPQDDGADPRVEPQGDGADPRVEPPR